MSFYCNDCKNTFAEPATSVGGFTHEFGAEPYLVLVCPFCDGVDFEPAVPCGNPTCNVGLMRKTDHICPSCRADLLERVKGFFDTLTAEEEAQFDVWMDGESILNRGKFA